MKYWTEEERKEAKRLYAIEYEKTHKEERKIQKRKTTMYKAICFVYSTDKELIEYINSLDNFSGLVKNLLREDMNRHKGDNE